MILGSYQPIWAPVTLFDGTDISAIVFVADPAHFQYEEDSRVESIAPLIARASGGLGTNREYVLRLDETLRDNGLADEYVCRVKERVVAEAAGNHSQTPGSVRRVRL